MCFHIDGKTSLAAKCVKSRIMTKVIDCVLLVHTFEKNVLCLKVCYNKRVLNITGILLLLTNHQAKNIFLYTDVFKKSRNYTNMLVSMTTNNNSKILLKPL